MANNYCESSSKLSLREDQVQKAREIIARICTEIENPEDPMEDDCVGVEIDVEDDGVWFHHDESINVENVEIIVQALLDELEIDEPFVFSWSYSCSKPRLDEFGGGACALKRGEPAFYVDAMHIASEHFKKP